MAKTKVQNTFTPNPEQAEAINAGQGVWSIVAGAGSGKTSVLVARYQRLLADGTPPDEILGLTFTSSGAKNMRDRAGVQKMDGRVNGFVTFHSLCLSIVVAEREHFGFPLEDFPLATEGQAGKILSEISKKYELDFKRVRNWISLQKRNGVRPKEALAAAEKEGRDEKMALAYKAFDQKLRETKVLDFDSMMLEVVTLLKSNPEVLARWSFSQIMVDEAQDCSPQDYELVSLLSRRSGNVFLVGDGGQGVFGFRGSDSNMFMNLPDTRVLYMGKNHRSTGAIVGFLKEIGPIRELADLFHTDNEFGISPVVVGYPSAVDEAKAVANACSNVAKGTTVAVIGRTNRSLRQFEDTFSAEGIKYYLQSKSGYWQQNEVKSVLAYLQCCVFPSDAAVLAALRSPFHPSRYVRKSLVATDLKNNKPADQLSVQYLHTYPNEQVRNFVHFLDGLRRYNNLPPEEAVKSVLSALHAMEYFKEEESTPDNSPVENLQELVKAASRFTSVKEFLDFTRRASAASKNRKGICLGTCHSVKGLEYDIVYFVQLNEGTLPHSKAESLEEEKRVFFVGASRARNLLTMSYAGLPSQFLGPYLKKQLDEVFA